MATAAAITPPLLAADANPSDAAPFPEEQQHLTLAFDNPSTTSQPDKSESLTPPVPKQVPVFVKSIAELKDLSAAIASFQQCYEDLHNHLDSVKTAIMWNLPKETLLATPNPDASEPASIPDVPEPAAKTDIAKSSPRPDVSDGTLLQKQQQKPNPLNSELEGLCKTMCSRGVRKYLVTHLHNLTQLREEVPKALKLAPKPPKLVLECLGKFYLQGSRAFTKNTNMIPPRKASIFVLECFLLMMGKEEGVFSIEKAVRVEAEQAALAWQKRMVAEGGLAQANQIDARGLLLFIACFGIPNSFKMVDIQDLVVAANAKEIAGVLRISQVLMKKISEIVERMIKHKTEVEAVDLIYTFGLEERFDPQNILVSYLQRSYESWKNLPKMGSQTTVAAVNEANKKQLSTLQSIRKCLERHNIDPAELLPDWQINETITSLEKDYPTIDKISEDKRAHKRKPSENEKPPRKPKANPPKRPRYNMNHGPQHHHHMPDSRINPTSRHHGSNNNNNIHPASTPVVYGGPGAGLLPESLVPHPHHGPAQYAGGVHGGADMYPWVMDERYGHGGVHSSTAGGVGLHGLYGVVAPPAAEGFAGGLPNTSRGDSNLYQFADSVVESKPYGGGGSRIATGGPVYHPPYPYEG